MLLPTICFAMVSAWTGVFSLRDTALGFSGGGNWEAASWTHQLMAPNVQNPWYSWYATEGNQLPQQLADASGNLQWFTNGTYPGRLQPAGTREVTEMAKLIERKDGLGTDDDAQKAKVKSFFERSFWHHVRTALFGGPMSSMRWYAPDGSALIQNEQPVITDFILRQKALQPPPPQSVWEIGNEPNLSPSITPRQYADLFTRYYRTIKQGPNGDPDALLGTSLFSTDLTLPGSITLLNTMMGQRLESYDQVLYGAEAAVLTTTFGAATLFPVFAGWAFVVELGASAYVNTAYSRAKRDTRNCLVRRLKMTDDGAWADQPTVPWFKTFVSALPDDVPPDYIGLHTYPLLHQNLNGYDQDSAIRSINRQVREMQMAWVERFAVAADVNRIKSIVLSNPKANLTAEKVATAQSGIRNIPAIWITEFGNVNPQTTAFNDDAAANLVMAMWDSFSANPNIHRWFFFKGRGIDAKLASVGLAAPMSRLVQSASETAPFICDSLSTIGRDVNFRLGRTSCPTPIPAPRKLLSNSTGWQSSSPISQPNWLRPTTNDPAHLISGSGYRIISKKIHASQLAELLQFGRAGYDVFVPTVQQNPWWFGETQLSIHAPQAGIWNRWIGRQSFDSADRGNWNPVSFEIPADVKRALSHSTDSIRFDIVLLGDGSFGVDGLRLESVPAKRFPSIRPTTKVLDFEDLSDWTSSQASLRLDTTNAVSGRYYLQITTPGYSTVTSRDFDRDIIQPRHTHIVASVSKPIGGNPYWGGTLAAYLTCRNQNVNHAWLGQLDLATIQATSWSRVSFPLPPSLRTSKYGGACQVEWAFNGNGSGGNYKLDRIGFSSTTNWEDEAQRPLTPTGGAPGFPDTTWHANMLRTVTLDSSWITIPALPGVGDSIQIELEDLSGRSIVGSWEAQAANNTWVTTGIIDRNDSLSGRVLRLPVGPAKIRLHLGSIASPSECPIPADTSVACLIMPITSIRIIWDYVLSGEDSDL